MSTSSRMDYDHSTKGAWAYGLASFAGVVLVMLGLFQFLQGLSAAFKDDVFVKTSDYVYSIDLSAWGWIHMALGAVGIAIGLCVLYGQTWARAAGILIAVLSAVANFAFLPYYPFWAILLIAIDVLVIWALSSLVVNT
ncbi:MULTISPECIES: DUF7144 family membrane protein [unclassified Nocardioides]|uniref:DUF7144 family membrane protein n=1 Tax=Nocardioides sp. URHA0032 TaxID=1380388 RepID=UPI000490DEF1|nr:hypothetical protein [Nocardioides sp. URHA0032]